MPSAPPKTKFRFLAGDPCLDFINTRILQDGRVVELLEDFHDLLTWMTEAQLLLKEEAREAAKRWAGRPEGERILQRARSFRATLRKMVQGLTQGQSVSSVTVTRINRTLRQRLGYPQLVCRAGSFELRDHFEFDPPVGLLSPIAKAASELLSHREVARIKSCSNPKCPFCFYDTTKGLTREWCNGKDCDSSGRVLAVRQRSTGRKVARTVQRVRTSPRSTAGRAVSKKMSSKKKAVKRQSRQGSAAVEKKSPGRKVTPRTAKKASVSKKIVKSTKKEVTARKGSTRKKRPGAKKVASIKKVASRKKVNARKKVAVRKKVTGRKTATKKAGATKRVSRKKTVTKKAAATRKKLARKSPRKKMVKRTPKKMAAKRTSRKKSVRFQDSRVALRR